MLIKTKRELAHQRWFNLDNRLAFETVDRRYRLSYITADLASSLCHTTKAPKHKQIAVNVIYLTAPFARWNSGSQKKYVLESTSRFTLTLRPMTRLKYRWVDTGHTHVHTYIGGSIYWTCISGVLFIFGEGFELRSLCNPSLALSLRNLSFNL